MAQATTLSTTQPVVVRALRAMSRWRRPVLIIPVFILTLVVVAGITADWITPYDPEVGDPNHRLQPGFWGYEPVPPVIVTKEVVAVISPSDIEKQKVQITEYNAKQIDPNAVIGDKLDVVVREGIDTLYILGTDHLGRDLFTRIIYGARVSLVMAGLTLLVGGTMGTVLGLTAGWYGGWIDEVVMRMVDIILALPLILVALVLVVALGPSFQLIIVIMAIAIWPLFTRVTRGEVLRVKTADYVALARVAGAGTLRIMFVHILPGIANSVIVVATLLVGVVILLEAALSFLGAGVPPPTPAWGSMLSEGRDRIAIAWWISTLPGLAIFMTVLSLNLFGDWLRDALDPRLRQLE
ncbi:MAG: ABC transporter permease [Chloroflexota bacterium]|nr:ABC transporter permease [Chloroflexota bacterium]MDE2962204.1 ABC transporter permease [Chloroflexota bacterium]